MDEGQRQSPKPRRNLDGMNKSLFKGSLVFSRIVASSGVAQYLDGDLSNFRNLQADYLARLEDGSFLHVEFQTSGDTSMPIRLKLYEKEIRDRYGEDIRLMQVVLKVDGQPGLSKVKKAFSHVYHEMVLDGAAVGSFMASPRIEDNLVAAFYAGGDEARLHMEILDRISHIADDDERSGRLAMFGLVMSYREKAPVPEVTEKMKEIAMGSQLWIEGNPIMEPAFNKGKAEGRAEGMAEGMAEGEARGILIGRAMSHDAPDSVIEVIRHCPAEELDRMKTRIEQAVKTSDWSEFSTPGPRLG